MNNKYNIAIDISGPYSSWCIADTANAVIESSSKAYPNRDNSAFFVNLISAMKKHNCKYSDIANWFVGIGPGSYTGIRVATSFLMGIDSASTCDSNFKGIPCIFPVVESIKDLNVNNSIAVLYPLTVGKILSYSVKLNSNGYTDVPSPDIITEDNKIEYFSNFTHIISNQKLDYTNVNLEFLKNKFIKLEQFPIEKMLTQNSLQHATTDISQLIYNRPAVRN